jgi:hypothetical protein
MLRDETWDIQSEDHRRGKPKGKKTGEVIMHRKHSNALAMVFVY